MDSVGKNIKAKETKNTLIVWRPFIFPLNLNLLGQNESES